MRRFLGRLAQACATTAVFIWIAGLVYVQMLGWPMQADLTGGLDHYFSGRPPGYPLSAADRLGLALTFILPVALLGLTAVVMLARKFLFPPNKGSVTPT
jgi:hypothetical protein